MVRSAVTFQDGGVSKGKRWGGAKHNVCRRSLIFTSMGTNAAEVLEFIPLCSFLEILNVNVTCTCIHRVDVGFPWTGNYLGANHCHNSSTHSEWINKCKC